MSSFTKAVTSMPWFLFIPDLMSTLYAGSLFHRKLFEIYGVGGKHLQMIGHKLIAMLCTLQLGPEKTFLSATVLVQVSMFLV